jgi:hypothetical protein
MLRARPPSEISDMVRSLGQRLSEGGCSPIYVPVQPMQRRSGETWAEVLRRVAPQQQDIRYGWTLWVCPGVFIQAERHAVLRIGSGYVDIVDQGVGVERVLFQPSQTADVHWSESDAVREPLSTDPLVLEWLKFTDDKAAFLKRHYAGNSLYLTTSMLQQLNTLEAKIRELEQIIAKRYS